MEDGDMEWGVTGWEYEVFDGGRDGVVGMCLVVAGRQTGRHVTAFRDRGITLPVLPQTERDSRIAPFFPHARHVVNGGMHLAILPSIIDTPMTDENVRSRWWAKSL
jgi:hypothetical protein